MKRSILLFSCLLLMLSLKISYSAPTIDPIKFTISTNQTHIELNKDFALTITAEYIDIPSNAAYILEGSNSFKLKLIVPDGFIRTGGNFHDYVGTELNKNNVRVSYTLNGRFSNTETNGVFELLRSHKNADNHSAFIAVGKITFTPQKQLLNTSASNATKSSNDAPNFVPYLTIAQLRSGIAANAEVVIITDDLRSGTFIYDSDDVTSSDDNATVLKVDTTGRIYKRQIPDGLINVEWFGANGNDLLTDRPAFIAAQSRAIALGIKWLIPRGIFYLGGVDSTHFSLLSNSHVVGYGPTISKVRLMTNTNRDLFVAVNRTNISISNIGFSADNQNDGSKTNSLKFDRCVNVKLSDLEITETKTGIFLLGAGANGCRNVTIQRVYFPRVYDFAIRAKDNIPTNLSISYCAVDSVLNNVANGETSAFRIMGKDITVSYCTVNYSYDTGIMVSGSDNDGVVVDNNYIRSRNVGIFVGTGAKRVTAHANDISSLNDHGIHAYNPGSTGIYSGNIFTANQIHDCAKTGIYIEGMSGMTVVSNIIARVGKRPDVTTRERTGITIISNTSALNAGKIDVNSNVIYDDQTSPTIQRGISIETTSLDNLEIRSNSITNMNDANKVYFPASVIERNIYSITTNIETAKASFTSKALSVGEITNSNRPLANSFTRNALYYNRETNLYEYSDGTNWNTLTTAAGFLSKTSDDTISGQKTWASTGIFWKNTAPQLRLSYDVDNYVDFFSNSSGNLVATPSGGTMTINGNVVMGNNNSNLFVTNNTGISNTITSGGYLFGSAASVQMRVGLRGTANGTLSANNSYASFIVGAQPVTASTSGTHNYIASAVFKAPIITPNSSTITGTATVLIDDEESDGINNFGLVNRVRSRFVGAVQADSTVTALQYRLASLNTAPVSKNAPGIKGEIRVTETHIYICTATNTWVRTELLSW